METINTLTGPRKAALLLMVMGEQFASHVFKHLDEREVKTIGEHMSQLKTVDTSLISSVMNEFQESCRKNNLLGVSGKNFFQKIKGTPHEPCKSGSYCHQ